MNEMVIIIIVILLLCVVLYYNDICVNNIVVTACVVLTLSILALKYKVIFGGAKEKGIVKKEIVGKEIVEHLRHHKNFGNRMNNQGYVLVDDVQDYINMKYHWTNDNAEFKVIDWKIIMDNIENEKNKRLEFVENNEGETYIRAIQGHTNLKIPLKEALLNTDIQHVTTEEGWNKIKESGGMKVMNRFYMMFNKAGGPPGRPDRVKYPITIIVSKDKVSNDGTIKFGYNEETGTWQTEGKFFSEEDKDGKPIEYYLLPIDMFSAVYRYDQPDVNLLHQSIN